MSNILNRLCPIHLVAYGLVLIGAINWGLVGIGWFIDYNLNIVNILLGTWPVIEGGVYLVVGISAIVMLFQASCTLCDDVQA